MAAVFLEKDMIHQYKLNGYNIVLDIFSGSVHVTDDLMYDIIELYQTKDINEIKDIILKSYAINLEEFQECIDSIEELKEAGLLFSQDTFLEQALEKDRGPVPIKALCLHVAHACNLNCEYCFASQGNYKGKRALMSYETGRRAIDFLIEHSGSVRNLDVDFFGGEPLMNWEVCKKLVAYARGKEKEFNKNFRFTLTTNGLLLDDEVIDFCNKEIDNVVLSLDGRKEIHDRLRKDLSGKGSYDIIVPKFQEFVKRRTRGTYYIRGTYTHNNTDFTKDVFHMADLGFKDLSMEPVVSSNDKEYALTEKDLPILLNEYEILAKEMIKRKKENREFTFYHFTIDLNQGPCIYKRLDGCGSGCEYMAVTPQGDLYPCHQFVSEKEFLLGNIFDGLKNTQLMDNFKNTNIETKEACKDCWAKFYCAGGCAANAYYSKGSIREVNDYECTLFKKRIECAIMLNIAYQDIEAGIDV